MSRATLTFGRFNPPTETGHGKLVSAVQSHAEETGGKHYIFPSHTQDKKKNPLTHEEKVGAMRKLFPSANVVSNDKVKTAIDAMKHLESKGHTHVTMVVGSDRVAEFHGLLSKYRKKEFPGIKKVEVKSAGHRDPDAEGAEGMSASKLRGLVSSGKKKEFVSHYSDPKLGAHIHDRVKAGMQMESVNPVGIFLIGGPGSGKDYVLSNIFSRFDLTEVQIDHLLNGSADELLEQKKNIVINGSIDEDKIAVVNSLLEGYDVDYVYVSVTNKVSRLRNGLRENPLAETKRIEKWLRAEKLAESLECFKFNNSINLNESSDFEKVFFADQIEKLLSRLVEHGLQIQEIAEAKTFAPVAKHKSGLPKKYVGKLSHSTALARKAHWKKMSKYSDRDPRAYKPAPGDATSKTKPSKHTLAVRKMMDEDIVNEGQADKSLAAKAAKSGISVGTLRKVYRRGVAAWNSGHRPGTTPSQWGHARVNSYINKGKTYHTADKDLREENEDINKLFEVQLMGTDEYRKHAIAMTPGQGEPVDAFPVKSPNKKSSAVVATKGKSIGSQYEEHTECGTPNCCGECQTNEEETAKQNVNKEPKIKIESSGESNNRNLRKFGEYRKTFEEEKEGQTADVTPTLKSKKTKSTVKPPRNLDSTLQGLPVTARFNALEEKIPTIEEAVSYHLNEKISFTENVFRPGSDMFFKMIKEAKRLYKEGKYTPKDEWETDMLDTDIGEKAVFEGKDIILDYPFDEEINEEDKTEGKGIGKPWREGGGGAVYVRTGDGGIKKVRFSQSGMKKKFMDPGATRSFVARHHCLTNKDKTSASYWACRYPRFFSNSGKTWW